MNWTREIKQGDTVTSQSGQTEDPYWKAAMDAKASGISVARVSSTVTNGSDFGQRKCSTTVSIECPQSKQYMDLAAMLAFKAAVEYTNDGMTYVDPNIAPFQSP